MPDRNIKNGSGKIILPKHELRSSPLGYWDFGFAKYDHSRMRRQGFPEAIYSPSKTLKQLIHLAKEFIKAEAQWPILFTRLAVPAAHAIKKLAPSRVQYNTAGRILSIAPKKPISLTPFDSYHVSVLAAGTGDIPVAEEAAFTCEALGTRAQRLYDVGVGGVHRLFNNWKVLEGASCVIVCAGMEGALPSVVGGMVACPVIGVPTSIGYGVAEGGRTALYTMLSSCASNVSVVNIDNGFSAGIIAHLMRTAKCLIKS